jgi:hypothetical protein
MPAGKIREDGFVRRGGIALLLVLAGTGTASADVDLYDRLWPQAPASGGLTMSQQLTDYFTELGNTLGQHVDLLSADMIGMRFDGRRRKAYVRVGMGDEQYLTLRIASDVQFSQGAARINTRVDLTVAGRGLHLELPEVEMVPTEFHGDRGVAVRLPIFKRTF